MTSQSTIGKRRVPLHKKLAGLALGTVLSLLCLELTLWGLHAAYAPESRGLAELAPQPGERRILCMGDSNTYGMYLESSDSYPGRLQSYLDAAPDSPWRVFNLGYPGQNTAQMRARLAQNLAAYRPEVLVLWGGVNNTWSPAMSHLWDSPDNEPSEGSLLDKSRAFGALRMMFLKGKRISLEGEERRYSKRMTRDGDLTVPGLAGAERGEGLGDVESVDSKTDKVNNNPEKVRRSIGVDLRRIHALCEEHGVALVLGQYWVDLDWIDYRINDPTAAFAKMAGVPVVQLRDRIRALVDTYGFDRILFHDYHAKATGNREVARQVLLTLVREGLVEGAREWGAIPPLEEVLGPSTYARELLTIEVLGRAGDLVDLEMTGPVRSRFAVNVHALVRGGGGGELAARPFAEPPAALTGRFDHDGTVHRTIGLPPVVDASVVGWRVLVTFADGEGATPASANFVDVPLASDR
ncbi:MAG: hypothetical protein GY711_00350 [bacterium]|nr:hypothetical protein [bacterium]